MSSLQEVLQSYLDQKNCNPNRLARMSGVHRSTIVNWLRGWVDRPRYWYDLAKVAVALRLSADEVNALLHAAGYPSVPTLLAQANDGERNLLTFWNEAPQPSDARAPFLPIARLPHFVGREAEVMLLQEALLSGDGGNLCCLQGMGGVGKTALAVHLAYVLSPYFADGVLWAQVDKSDTMAILSAFAHVYGVDVSAYADVRSRSQVVRALLAGKHALLVLDNVQESEQVRPLLPPSGTCMTLITTRRHDLAVTRAAYRLTLGPFSKTKGEALDLFSKILGTETVNRDSAMLSEISDLLGQLPLAIDITASRLAYEPDWTTDELLARLRDQRRRLSELIYDDQAVRWSFDLSYAALSAQDQTLFCAMGVFEGVDFDAEALAHVVGRPSDEARDGLRRLHGLSLLQSARPGRYRLHPLLLDYAREQRSFPGYLREGREPYVVSSDGTGEGGCDAVCERMLAYFVDFAVAHEWDDVALESEESNLLAALNLARRYQKHAALIRGAHALYRYLEVQGRYALAKEYLEWTEQFARASVYPATAMGRDMQHARDLALTLSRLGWLSMRQSDYDRAWDYFQESLDLVRCIEDDEIMIFVLKGLGGVAYYRAECAQAEGFLQHALLFAREAGNRSEEAGCLNNLGLVYWSMGKMDRALDHLERSLSIAREIGNKRGEARDLKNLGLVYRELNEMERAILYYEQSLEIAREIGDRAHVGVCLGNIGVAYHWWGQAERGLGYLERAVAIAREVGDCAAEVLQLNHIGNIYGDLSRFELAIEHYERALAIARKLGDDAKAGAQLCDLGNAYYAQGQVARAREFWEQAAQTLESFSAHAWSAYILCGVRWRLATTDPGWENPQKRALLLSDVTSAYQTAKEISAAPGFAQYLLDGHLAAMREAGVVGLQPLYDLLGHQL
ncbi:MAG: tetratricopeptide repeat protein [Anaerolineae bacterium]|nr:tetratricopeptide repeat protein [Anaerolineae bacterium]